MIFNEKNLYKDKDVPDRAGKPTKKKEQVKLEEIIEDDVIKGAIEDPEPVPETPQLRRSARIPKPRERYLPSLHYLLLIDGGELECYEEAVESEDSVK